MSSRARLCAHATSRRGTESALRCVCTRALRALALVSAHPACTDARVLTHSRFHASPRHGDSTLRLSVPLCESCRESRAASSPGRSRPSSSPHLLHPTRLDATEPAPDGSAPDGSVLGDELAEGGEHAIVLLLRRERGGGGARGGGLDLAHARALASQRLLNSRAAQPLLLHLRSSAAGSGKAGVARRERRGVNGVDVGASPARCGGHGFERRCR